MDIHKEQLTKEEVLTYIEDELKILEEYGEGMDESVYAYDAKDEDYFEGLADAYGHLQYVVSKIKV